MTKKEMIEALEKFEDNQRIVCVDGGGYWNYVDHILGLKNRLTSRDGWGKIGTIEEQPEDPGDERQLLFQRPDL